MKRIALCTVLALLPVPAFADDIFCELPWFARNLIFDQAGYCFGSLLGQATFDNSDCISTDIALSDRDRAAVDHILGLEDYLGCAIDSSAPRLDHQAHFEHLRDADVIPAPVEHESGCIGYRGPAQPLRAAPSDQARVIGELLPGDDISFIFLSEGRWEYLLIHNESGPIETRRHGWAPVGLGYVECEMYAG